MRHATLGPFVAALLLVVFSGCMETGVGDPATATPDPRLEGLWQVQNDKTLVLVKPWGDAHTYAVSEVKGSTDGGVTKYTSTDTDKAWLTRIGDLTFITFDVSPHTVTKEAKPYMVGRITFRDDNTISARGVNPEFAGNAKTPAELEKLIKENLENPKLWAGKEDVVYTRVSKS